MTMAPSSITTSKSTEDEEGLEAVSQAENGETETESNKNLPKDGDTKHPPPSRSPLHIDTTHNDNATTNDSDHISSVDQSREIFEERFGKPTRQAIRDFFYRKQSSNDNDEPATTPPPQVDEEEQDRLWVENFWRTYDDIIFISLFTQLGMVFRLAAAKWFSVFDNTFRADSALFVNLPLNCLASFLMGFFGDGPSLMSIVETRFTPQDLQQAIQQETLNSPIGGGGASVDNTGLRQRRRGQREPPTRWTTPNRVGDVEMREVQLLALERRIRASPCLVLFPIKKEDVDVMDHYFSSGYQRRQKSGDEMDVEDCQATSSPLMGSDNVVTMVDDEEGVVTVALTTPAQNGMHRRRGSPSNPRTPPPPVVPSAADDHDETDAPGVDRDLDQIIHDVSANITHNIQDATSNVKTNIDRMRRVSLAEGWDVGTTAQAMSDDLLLGLRDGFCGALSTFSSWSSSMVNLLRNGQVSDAVVGYVIGIQLPIVAYRFGQNMAVYLFIWRSRRETRKDERRGGYGIRLPQADDDEESDEDEMDSPNTSADSTPEESEMPSVRAIATAIFMLLVVTQLTSLSFFRDPTQHQIALALFFSPLGVLTRWRISRYNRLIAGFPIGTFISNMLGCALSGSLGQLLAGNPGPRERIVLQSLIRGFAGSLSSVSALVVEVLAGTDPLLFRFDGFTYASCTIFWGAVIGFIVETSLDWAETSAAPAVDDGRNLTAAIFSVYNNQ